MRGLTPKNVTALSRALPVLSVMKPSRPRRECFAVLGYRRGGLQNLAGFGVKPPDLRRLTPKNRPLILRADARFFSWQTLAPPARVFCGARIEAGGSALIEMFLVLEATLLGKRRRGPQNLPVFGGKPSDSRGWTPKNQTQILRSCVRFLNWETLTPSA